ncbi:MAG: hypothetical protein CMQ77_03610 [Gammaproteobacteria bacterium]|nr:hypothetical protein [Gammaproteobacteria bacterium]
MLSFITQQHSNSKGFMKRIWGLVRVILITVFSDPKTSYVINGKKIIVPLSHAVPDYISSFTHYDNLPIRIANFFDKNNIEISCVDVGANVGDTLALFDSHNKIESKFLAIEPHVKFSKYLDLNWKSDERVEIIYEICSSKDEFSNNAFVEKSGTAFINLNDNGEPIKQRTLDSMLKELKNLKKPNIIKIDTDGYDFEVLKGAKHTITNNMPWIMFEVFTIQNKNYVEDCINSLVDLKNYGYSNLFIYDNLGNYHGNYQIDDIAFSKKILFYQLTADSFYCFDFLVVPEDFSKSFLNDELSYFINSCRDATMFESAKKLID